MAASVEQMTVSINHVGDRAGEANALSAESGRLAVEGETVIGQTVRDDGPQTHLSKSGTPTMGGALILVAIAATTLLWADLGNRRVWVSLVVTLTLLAAGVFYSLWRTRTDASAAAVPEAAPPHEARAHRA